MPTAATTLRIPRPATGECNEYYLRYISRVPGDDALPVLAREIESTTRLLGGLSEERARHRYAPGKWSVKEVIGHLSDAERVFSYRALRFGRADTTPLPGFDENVYVPASRFDQRPLAEVLDEFRAVRAASLTLFRSFDEAAIVRSGEASGNPVSVRALAWIIAGHEIHHVEILKERYGVQAG